jgi:hypothetical protein
MRRWRVDNLADHRHMPNDMPNSIPRTPSSESGEKRADGGKNRGNIRAITKNTMPMDNSDPGFFSRLRENIF